MDIVDDVYHLNRFASNFYRKGGTDSLLNCSQDSVGKIQIFMHLQSVHLIAGVELWE